MTIIDMDKMGEALNNKADIDLNNTGVFSTSEGGCGKPHFFYAR